MGGFSNAEEAAVLEWYFAAQAKTPPASVFVGLTSDEPNDDGTFTEIAYTGYARQQVLAAEWTIPATQGDPTELLNAQQITFPLCSEDTGLTATHFVLMTLVTAGVMLFSGLIVQPAAGLPLNDGVQPQFDAGALRARLGG